MGIIRRSGNNKDALLRKAHLGAVDNAEEILELAKKQNICLTPLDVEKLADKLGIRVIRVPMDSDISGNLKYDLENEQWIMCVNALHHDTRQRFTIAHEIGHYILHRKDKIEFTDKVFFRDGAIDVYEHEANRFASNILMPEADFIHYVRYVSDNINDIAAYFGVSPLAVEYRAKQVRV